MPEMGAWNGHSFTVSPQVIRSFADLSISASSETSDKKEGSQGIVAWKNGNAAEVSFSVTLSALTGCDVRTEALQFIDEARSGAKDYFYVGGQKLLTCQLMLTDAQVSDTVLAPSGVWVSCKVSLSFKQCTKYDGEKGGSKKGSGKGNGKDNRTWIEKMIDLAQEVEAAKKATVERAALIDNVAGAAASAAGGSVKKTETETTTEESAVQEAEQQAEVTSQDHVDKLRKEAAAESAKKTTFDPSKLYYEED